jgi:hypothetical protein
MSGKRIPIGRTLMKLDCQDKENLVGGGRGQMSKVEFERIWIAQCEASRRVKSHFGLANALD